MPQIGALGPKPPHNKAGYTTNRCDYMGPLALNYIMTETQTYTRKTHDSYDFTNWCETDGHTDGHTDERTHPLIEIRSRI